MRSTSGKPLHAKFVLKFFRRPLRWFGYLEPLRFVAGHNFLSDQGWFESQRQGLPVTVEGDPLPWYTYSAINFLGDRLPAEVRIFEWGGGYSTRWYSERVDEVVAVEHDPEWVDRIGPSLPRNAELIHREDPEKYVHEAADRGPFDVLVIDGKHRDDCADVVADALADGGVVILDDYRLVASDDVDSPYELADFESLTDSFRMLPFYGMKPISSNKRCTAIFYREDNCLGI